MEATGLSLDDLVHGIKNAVGRAEVVVILDTAFVASGLRKAGYRSKSFLPVNIDSDTTEHVQFDLPPDCVILLASRRDAFEPVGGVSDGQVQNGVFTHFILRKLADRNDDGVVDKADALRPSSIDLFQVFDYTAEQLASIAPEQVPELIGSLGRPFRFLYIPPAGLLALARAIADESGESEKPSLAVAKARRLLEQVVAVEPKNIGAQLLLAKLDSGSLDSGQIKSRYSQLLALWLDGSERARVYSEWARAHTRVGDYNSAKSLYEESLRLDPGQPEVAGEYAVSLGRVGDIARAIDYAMHLPEDGTTLVALGDLQRLAGRSSDAFQTYMRAVARGGDRERIFSRLAWISFGSRQYDQAIELAKRAYKGDDYLELLQVIALELQGRFDEAAQALRDARQTIDPGSLIGEVAAYLAGELTEEKLLAEVEGSSVRGCKVYFYVAMATLARKDVDTSRSWLKRAIESGILHEEEGLVAGMLEITYPQGTAPLR